MKHFAVVFDKHNARIVTGDTTHLEGKEGVLFNPTLPNGRPPHHWKLEDGRITLHDDEECKRRDLLLHGPYNDTASLAPASKIEEHHHHHHHHHPVERKEVVHLVKTVSWVWSAILAAASSALVWELVHLHGQH